MKIGIRQNWQEPSDSEIESDVAELRRLLDGIEGPNEPHPAYWQNFLVHTRRRLDEQHARRRRFSPSLAWSSLSAAALAVVLVVGGVLPTSTNSTVNGSGGQIAKAQPSILSAEDGSDILGLSGLDADPSASLSLSAGEPAIDKSTSILLSSDDVRMINAIMSEEDDEAILTAMVETSASL